MNLRQRWWMATALMVLSAAGAQRVRAQELPQETAVAAPASAPAAAQGRALCAVRPGAHVLDAHALDLLQSESESAYRAGDHQQALRGFSNLLDHDPCNTMAWFRLGNLHQQAGREEDALRAYQQAASMSVSGESGEIAQIRGKAWLNIALLNVARASRAIDALDSLQIAALKSNRHAAARQVGAERHRAYRSAQRAFDVEIPSQVMRPRAESSADRIDAASSPYTVDRWVSMPRRASVRPASGRSAVIEPLTETPLPAAPSVELMQGASGSASRSAPKP